MKLHWAITVGLIGTALIATPNFAQAPEKKRTVWVPPPTGSLIGGGYAATSDPENRSAKVLAGDPAMQVALDTLNAQASTTVEGWTLIANAVAWQTGVRLDTINRQHAKTKLTYGDLLAANTIATASGKSFESVVTAQAKARAWAPVARQLGVNPDSITARARTAADSIKFAEAKKNRQREHNIRDSGVDGRGPNANNLPGGG
jgi:hypothetical protein